MKYRVDTNQAQIVEALRVAGFQVYDFSRCGRGIPDLLVCDHFRVVMLEIKTPKGRLTPAEAEFHAAYRGELYIVRSVEDALRAMGIWNGGT